MLNAIQFCEHTILIAPVQNGRDNFKPKAHMKNKGGLFYVTGARLLKASQLVRAIRRFKRRIYSGRCGAESDIPLEKIRTLRRRHIEP